MRANDRIRPARPSSRERIATARVAIDLLAGATSAGAMRVLPVDAAQVHASRRRLPACAPIALCVVHCAMDAARSIRLV